MMSMDNRPAHVIIGAAGVLFFGIGAVILGVQLALKPVVLQIDDEGYTDRTSLASPGRVFWSEIAAVSIVQGESDRFLKVAIADPEALLRRVAFCAAC